MASLPAAAKVEKLSFAKVAAAGLKPPSAQPSPIRADATKKHEATSPPPDGGKLVSPSSNSNQAVFTPKQKKIVALAPVTTEELDSVDIQSPAVHVQTVQSASPPIKTPRALDGMLMPARADDAGTQASSSDSVKPPSLDGKSVTSGTTFALDEKESLRPDDSASVKARDDEDSLPTPEVSLPATQAGSEEDMRAFRDQLAEISHMDSGRQHVHPQGFSHGLHAAPGVLYVPPTGPGVGNIPGTARDTSAGVDHSIDCPPDPKLLEALDSPKDRIMVLKLEQDIVDFVKDAKEHSLKLPQTNTFYRMLAHKLADYYMLGHVVDETTLAVRIYKTPNCRLPPPLTGIATPSTAASTPPPVGPQMKILRRGVDNAGPTIANGSNVTSKTTSENGESGNEDDKKGKVATREEREARYEAARKRILGSAKPSDSPEEPVEVDNSRSSSAAGRKNSRKKRADSDDDFEARSAYSAYYAVPQNTPGAPVPSHYGYPNGAHAQGTQFSPANYPSQAMAAGFQQYNGQPASPWMNQAYYPQQGPPNWMPQPQPGYDMSADFQRAMSFQSSPVPAQYPTMQTGYGVQYNPQMGAPQQAWAQQSPYMGGYPSQPAQPHVQSYPARTPPMSTQTPDNQPYQYGQLPSQAFPGRPPSKLEHPLPGSYKSKHFNPQSQSFIPTHMNGPNTMPFQPQTLPMNSPTFVPGYGMPTTPQRQPSAPSQNAMYAQPQPPPSTGAAAARMPAQPMTHPLPQPVFPQQPSPAVPLPPKPETTPPKPVDKNANGPAIVSSVPSGGYNQGSILKWATPATLPPKPPPVNGGIPMTGHVAQSSRT